MLGSLVVGSFALSLVMERKYELTDARNPKLSAQDETSLELHGAGKRANKQFSPEEEYSRMMSTLDIEHWENKRVPRPPGEEDD